MTLFNQSKTAASWMALALLSLGGGTARADVNAVPYIATYYVKPRVNLTEKITIDYYVTDAAHKEYLKDDRTETFTVDYWLNGVKSTAGRVQAGDNRITVGPLPQGEVLLGLQATDKLGRKSHRLFQEFLVVDPRDSVIPKEKVLTPDLQEFGVHNDDSHPVETTKGLTELLKWASDNGYRKVVLPTGCYRLDENSTVQMASNLILDMNGSTFKLNPNALDKAMMFEMYQCYNSHVMNGTFEGDLKEHDFKTAPNNSEWVCAINMGQDTKYSTFQNIKIVDVTGYGSNTGLGGNGTRTYSSVPPRSIGKLEPGDVDTAGQLVPSTVRTSTAKPVDISPFLEKHGFFQLGTYLGYQGNPAGNWVYKASFYDADQKFLEGIEGYMYRRLYPPTKARFAHFTLLSPATPANLSLFDFRPPYNCAFINVHHENVRCVGMVPSGFNNLLVEGNTFKNCGWSSARCAFDAEDGWDLMQDLTFRNNTFAENPSNEFLTCAGHNFVMENNTMKVYMWDRTRSAVFRNNKIKSGSFLVGTRNRSGYHRIAGNTYEGPVNINTQTPTPDAEFCIRDSVLPHGAGTSAHPKSGAQAGFYFKSQITGGSLTAKAVDCDIKGVENIGGSFHFENCRIEDSKLKTSGGKRSLITGSTVRNSHVVTLGSAVEVENSKLFDTDFTATQDWSAAHEFVLKGNRIETSLENLVLIGNSYKSVLLENNTITASHPNFSAVILNNPTKDSLVNQSVRLAGNTFTGKGGLALNVKRLPHAAAKLAVKLANNTLHGMTEVNPNVLQAENVLVTRQ